MRRPRRRRGVLERLFEPLLNHDCANEGHGFKPEGYCFFCGKTREEVAALIEGGEYQLDAILYLESEISGEP